MSGEDATAAAAEQAAESDDDLTAYQAFRVESPLAVGVVDRGPRVSIEPNEDVVITVTPAQVRAARSLAQRQDRRGQQPDPLLLTIASAPIIGFGENSVSSSVSADTSSEEEAPSGPEKHRNR